MDRSGQHCVHCDAAPPKTETTYTLIEQYGWRLTVTVDSNARRKTELWCADCWAAHHATPSSNRSSRRQPLDR